MGKQWAVVVLVLVTGAVWRAGWTSVGFGLSALTVVIALWCGRPTSHAGAWLSLRALLTAGFAALGLSSSLWPCELGCSGGEFYRNVVDLPLLWFATPIYAAFGVWVLIDSRKPEQSWSTLLPGWALVGVSVYYLLLAWKLDMVCGHCLAVHTSVLAWLSLLRPSFFAVGGGVVAAGVAGGGVHVMYHGFAGFEPQEPSPVVAENGGEDPSSAIEANNADEEREAQALEAAQQGRMRGSEDAPLTLEMIFAFSCERCARSHGTLANGLQRHVDAGTLRLVFRHRFDRRVEEGVELVKLAFAAAALGRYELYQHDVFAAQGHGHSSHEQLEDLGEHTRLDDFYRWLQANGGAAETLVTEDDQRIEELKAGQDLPHLVLLSTKTDEELARFNERINVADVAREVTLAHHRLKQEESR